MHNVDVYDFDGTVYNGDSSIDFLLYSIKRKKKLIKYLPKIFVFMMLNFLGLISTKRFKEVYFSFIKDVENIENFINEFWKDKEKKINNFFIENIQNTAKNYVISASPEFLLKPYISKLKNVKLIATKFDKDGKIIGENCKGEEKVRLLKKTEKDISVENFYTDSLDDLPLIKIAKNCYYMNGNNIENFNIDKIRNKNNAKKCRMLFYIFLVFYLILGIQLSYNYDFSKNLDLLFNSDTARVISDMSNIFGSHHRLSVHPLFVLIVQPIYFIISGITQSRMIALIIISSIISSITVSMIYKIVSIYSNNDKMNILLSMCYGFIFSNFIFTAGIELYNIATLVLLLFWYFIAKKIEHKWNESDFLILVTLGILTLSITITNYVVFLIGCFILLVSKKVSFKELFIANVLVIVVFVLLSYFQNCIWQNTPIVTNLITSANREGRYIDFSIQLPKINKVIKDCLYNSMIASNVGLGFNEEYNKMITFNDMQLWNKIIITIFLGCTTFFTLKNIKKNLYINLGIILTIVFNFLFHLIYGNEYCFLYSLHFIYLIFLLFGINVSSEKNIKVNITIYAMLIFFLLSEIIINCKVFLQILKITSNILEKNYYATNFETGQLIIISFLIIIALIIIINLIAKFIKRIVKNNDISNKVKYAIFIFILIIVFESVFVALQTIPNYERIFWKSIEKEELIINKSYEQFNNAYPVEVNSYLEYIEEYKNFIEKYNCTIYDDIPDTQFYLFGMGNRRKILFKDNKLIDLQNNTIIKQFDLNEKLIIPNEYTVLIKENDGSFKKIYENDKGIYIESKTEKSLIDGTNVNINICTFDNQKYKNIKKVLYSEILFNIKNSIIYPNIFVYDEPWYRDAAIACMVLKQTNNTDLISDWVSSITNIYDQQNAGEKETDNLGELLYIISTQENKNNELITKIEQEAERIATNNPNGYYLYGRTDFSNQYRYQNMWYELGINSVGKEFKYNYNNLNDSYSGMIWWNNNKTKYSIKSKEYPYLSWAYYHANNKNGEVYVSNKLYPLSWEKSASQANYAAMNIIDKKFVETKISPTHVWTASEMLLFILDETGNLDKDEILLQTTN